MAKLEIVNKNERPSQPICTGDYIITEGENAYICYVDDAYLTMTNIENGDHTAIEVCSDNKIYARNVKEHFDHELKVEHIPQHDVHIKLTIGTQS